MTGALKQEVIDIYNNGYETPRAIAREYFNRHGVFPNIGSVKTYKKEYLQEKREKRTKIAIRIIAGVLIAFALVGIYLQNKDINKNMSQMYPKSSALSLYSR